MTLGERLPASLDRHPMRRLRDRLRSLGVVALGELRGERVTAAGVVIVRQRPGTAKGFVFVGLEEETGRLDVIPSSTKRSGRSSTATASWPCGESWERRTA